MTTEIFKIRMKKRKSWIVMGNTFVISGFFSFSNHPEWGLWVVVLGFIITTLALVVK